MQTIFIHFGYIILLFFLSVNLFVTILSFRQCPINVYSYINIIIFYIENISLKSAL